MADVKLFLGIHRAAEHPFTKEPIPVWIGDYVLQVRNRCSYGGSLWRRRLCFANFFKERNASYQNIFDQHFGSGLGPRRISISRF
jgi:leucyl-tRNA synthetase